MAAKAGRKWRLPSYPTGPAWLHSALDASESRRMNERDRHTALLNAKAEALTARVLLDELREGRVANALELLEQRLDASVLIIQKLAQQAKPSEREHASAALRVIRDYRQRQPRRTEAVIEGSDESELNATREAVREILHATN